MENMKQLFNISSHNCRLCTIFQVVLLGDRWEKIVICEMEKEWNDKRHYTIPPLHL